jgi:hypothetical protein
LLVVQIPIVKTKARFIQPMLLLRMEKLPEGADWLYEIKLDGYRILAIKNGGEVRLRSRNNNDFTAHDTDRIRPSEKNEIIDDACQGQRADNPLDHAAGHWKTPQRRVSILSIRSLLTLQFWLPDNLSALKSIPLLGRNIRFRGCFRSSSGSYPMEGPSP